LLEIKNTEVFCIERSFLASGNPMTTGEIQTTRPLGKAELEIIGKRVKSLGTSKSGEGHDNFLSGF
jgi:hypothetical protein